MNINAFNMLNLIYQDNFSLDEISQYLKIEKKSINKAVVSINKFLEREKFPLLKIIDEKVCCDLDKEQWKFIFTQKNILSIDNILDYLYIKFIHNGFIILEEEKVILNVSRSSIFRYFTEIKKKLDKFGSSYSYVPTKGISLEKLSDENLHIFFKKLVKNIFINYQSLNKFKLIDKIIEKHNSSSLVKGLEKISKINNISMTNFLISFLCAFSICVDLFEQIDLKNSEINYSDYFKLEESIAFHLSEFTLRQQQQFFYFLVNLQSSDSYFEPNSLLKAKKLLVDLKENLNIENLDVSIENILLKKICYSIFKFDNQILKVKKVDLNIHEQKILEIINKSLNLANFDLFYSDKISIITILKKIIIEQNKNSVQKILVMYNEVVIEDDFFLNEKFKYYNHSFNFKIEPSFFYKLYPEKYEEKYDLILSDEPFFKRNTVLINSFDYDHILKVINNHIFEKFMDSAKV